MSPPDETSGSAFGPAQPQRWSLFAGFAQAMDSPAARRELRAWSALGVVALAVAGVFALLVALSRVPGAAETFPWPVQFFEKGLVIHVVLSFVVWFLSVLGALAVLAAYRVSAGRPRWPVLGLLAPAAAALATVLLLVPALTDRGGPSLNNYVPVIADPIYYGGLALLAVAVALAVVRLLASLVNREGPLDPVSRAVNETGVLYVIALACFALAWIGLGGGNGADAFSPAWNEDLFWGGGHMLQFLNTGLMLTAWYVLGGMALARPFVHPRLMAAAMTILVFSAVPGPVLYIVMAPFSSAQAAVFTNLQYLLAPPVVLVAGAGAVTVWSGLERGDGPPWRELGFQCLLLSAGVFAVGATLGLFVDGGDTRTPAHYHGVIGGVNLAFMGLYFVLLLPLLGRAPAPGKAPAASVWLYAWGQVLHSLGLFWAGGYGAPRKATAGGADPLADAGLYLTGVGAVIAVGGGVMFIVIAAKALLKSR